MTPWSHKVQYYETDAMGIVHHSNYIRWFEEARVELLRQIGYPYDALEKNGLGSPVLSVNCIYKTPSRFSDTVCIEASIARYTGTRLSLAYTITDAETGQLRCTGESSHCFMQNGRPVSLPKSWTALDRALQQEQTTPCE